MSLESPRHADLERATDERWTVFEKNLTYHLEAMNWGDEPDALTCRSSASGGARQTRHRTRASRSPARTV